MIIGVAMRWMLARGTAETLELGGLAKLNCARGTRLALEESTGAHTIQMQYCDHVQLKDSLVARQIRLV